MTIAQSIRRFYSALVPTSTSLRGASTQGFAYGFVVSVGSMVAIQALGALANIFIARGLGVEQFGLYTSVMVNLGLLTAFLGLGLDTWLIYEGGRRPERLVESAQQVIYVKLAGATVMLAAIGLGSVVSSEHILLLAIGALGVLLESFLQTGIAALRAQYRNGLAVLLQVTAPVILVISVILFMGFRLDPIVVVSLQAFASAVALGFAVFSTNLLARPYVRPRPLELLRTARSFLAGDVLATVYGLATLAFIGLFLGALATGIFKPAANIVGFSFVVPALVYSISLPMLSNPATSHETRRSLIKLISAIVVLYGIVLLLTLWLFGETILRILYGEAFAAGYPLIRIMSVIPLIKGGSFVCVAIMVSRGQQHLRVLLQLGAVVLSIVGSLLIIPAFGIEGAAYLQVAIEIALFVFYLAGARWTMRKLLLA